MKAALLFSMFVLATGVQAADPPVTPASELAKLWKRTKSLAAPVEKARKGMSLEVGESPAAAPQIREVKVDADTAVSFKNLQFQKNSAVLTGTTTYTQLAEIAKGMQAAGTEQFLIEGHTCDLGGESYNVTLSLQRAAAVKQALIELGAPPARLQIMAFGESNPVVPNIDENARLQNRRVQIFRKL